MVAFSYFLIYGYCEKEVWADFWYFEDLLSSSAACWILPIWSKASFECIFCSFENSFPPVLECLFWEPGALSLDCFAAPLKPIMLKLSPRFTSSRCTYEWIAAGIFPPRSLLSPLFEQTRCWYSCLKLWERDTASGSFLNRWEVFGILRSIIELDAIEEPYYLCGDDCWVVLYLCFH